MNLPTIIPTTLSPSNIPLPGMLAGRGSWVRGTRELWHEAFEKMIFSKGPLILTFSPQQYGEKEDSVVRSSRSELREGNCSCPIFSSNAKVTF
jgi:hypothetical protein